MNIKLEIGMVFFKSNDLSYIPRFRRGFKIFFLLPCGKTPQTETILHFYSNNVYMYICDAHTYIFVAVTVFLLKNLPYITKLKFLESFFKPYMLNNVESPQIN